MELEEEKMYNLEIINLEGSSSTLVTKIGSELIKDFDFLRVGQVVNEWVMYVVTPLGE